MQVGLTHGGAKHASFEVVDVLRKGVWILLAPWAAQGGVGRNRKRVRLLLLGRVGPNMIQQQQKKRCVAAPVAIVKSRWHAVRDSRNVGLQLGCDFMCRARGGAAGNDETP